ncbi:hypothetical protein [Cellvibrio fibrivorans]|uniref:RiboL-PSP-HEPN domain-containing protein n=1 Tax=Cellvibrio fibrivorans TaxID=126350 RepID=A0ABU1UTW1_9GAMM|nr:hypothetical protein [Cellvibrio fibrivorans]MDR7088613.1 hypothetical protein [Cellvibrio fibrivorans]
MKKWSLNIEDSELSTLYDNYLSKIDDISTLYSVVLYADTKIKADDFLKKDEEIFLSDNFSRGFTTVKSNEDMSACSVSGNLERINSYQTVISLVSNYENLTDSLIKHFKVCGSKIEMAKPNSNGRTIDSPILKKNQALHDVLNIHSNVIGSHELSYLYKIIRIRNRLVHNQGAIKESDLPLLKTWVKDNKIELEKNHIDDFIHFFLMPIRSMFLSLSEAVV